MTNFVATGRGGPPAASANELGAWVATLPVHDPSATARLLVEKLVVLNRCAGPARGRLRLLEMLRERVETVLLRLERELAAATLPLAPRLREIAYLAEKMQKELGVGYRDAALHTPRAWLALGLKRQVHAPLVRAMDLVVRRLMLCHRLYARSPGGAWSDLHQLYRLALDLGLHHRPLDVPSKTADELYRRALLTTFAEPSRLMPGELAKVEAYVEAFGAHARIESSLPAEPHCVFVIDPRRDRPGIAASKTRDDRDADCGLLYLSTRKLVDQMVQQLARLDNDVAPETLGLPAEGKDAAFRALLRRVAVNWRGDNRKRSTRLRFRPRVEVHIGFASAWPELATESEADNALAPGASEWVVLNESAGGFALRYMSGRAANVAVGDLVAVHARDRRSEYVCLVRRVVSNSAEHLEIGLQQIAPTAHAALGLLTPDESAPMRVLYCPEASPQGMPALVIAPAGRLDGCRDLFLRCQGGLMPLRIRRFAERTASVDLLEVASV